MCRRLRVLVFVVAFGLLAPALIGVSSAAAGVPVARAAHSGYVTMVSERGDYVGQGGSYLWRAGADSISVQQYASGSIEVSTAGGPNNDYFSFDLAPPSGRPLVAGSYPNAQRGATSTAAGLDVYGDGRGCNMVSGQFTVLDITPDLSRLWVVYEEHCEGGVPAVFGEIRLGEPASAAGLSTAPDRVAWPAAYPGVPGRVVPVTVVNSAGAATRITSAQVTKGTKDFTVVSNGCALLAARSECVVYVGFRPAAAGRRAGLLTLHTTRGARTVNLAGVGRPGHTTWTMRSDPGDFIGLGRDYSFTQANSVITASGNETHVHVGVSAASGDNFSADFEADSGHALVSGTTFTGATRYPFNDPQTPGLDVTGDSRGCNTSSGTFTVRDASYADGTVVRFVVAFVQHCEGVTPALHGTIDVDLSTLPPPPSSVAPAPVAQVAARGQLGAVRLAWTDPADVYTVTTVVRGALGDIAPVSPTSGTAVYSGPSQDIVVGDVPPGSDVSYSLFSRNDAGRYGPPVVVHVHGTDLSLGAEARVSAGASTVLRGRVIDVHTGAGVPGRRVALYTRTVHATTSWTLLAQSRTGAGGAYSLTTVIDRTRQYEAVVQGGPGFTGAVAGPVTVRATAVRA